MSTTLLVLQSQQKRVPSRVGMHAPESGLRPSKLDGPLSCRCRWQGQASACKEAIGGTPFPVKGANRYNSSRAECQHLVQVQGAEAAACGRQRGWGTPCPPQRSQ